MSPRLAFSLFAAAVSLLAFSGCATTTRATYTPPASGPTATVKGGSANVIKFFSEGASHVSIIEIDGLFLPESFWTGPVKEVKVTPGARKVTVLVRGKDYAAAQETITLETTAGRTYQIEARKTGIAFDVVIYEEGASEKDRKEVLTMRIQGQTSGSRPAYIPIIIPAGR